MCRFCNYLLGVFCSFFLCSFWLTSSPVSLYLGSFIGEKERGELQLIRIAIIYLVEAFCFSFIIIIIIISVLHLRSSE